MTRCLLSLLFYTIVLNGFAQEEWSNENSSDNSSMIARHENAFVESGGKFYLLGSRGIRKVQVYDPVTRKWSDGKNVPKEMHHFQAVEFSGKIYVICGFTGGYPTETPLANIYIYDTSSDLWAVGPEIPKERQRGSAGVVKYNNKFYIVAGVVNGHTSGHVKWFDEYNPATNEWKILADAPRERDHFGAAVINNKIVVAGGRLSSHPNTFGLTVKEVDVFDFSTNQWSTLSNNLPTLRAGTSVGVIDNEVFVIGGETGGQQLAHSETEALNIANGSWRTISPLNTGRHGTQAITYKNKIYIAAGSKTKGGNGSSELATMEVLSSVTITSSDNIESNKLNWNLYPNPCLDKIRLDFTTSSSAAKEIILLNSLGKALKTYSFVENFLEIDLSEFSDGVYYINEKNSSSIFRIVKGVRNN